MSCATKNDSSACASCSSRNSACASAGSSIMTKEDRAIAQTLSRIGHVLFVVSGKGGVGKSAVTANLAVALARQGKRVGILDVDMHGPSIPTLLGISGRLAPEDAELLAPAVSESGVRVISMDTLLENRNAAVIWRGPKKTAAIKQFISGVAWGDLDFLLIDSPPGTGDEHLAILRGIPSARCIVVTTPQELALADVRKAIHFLRRMRAEILGLVENMSGLVCPHCAGTIDLFTKGGGEATAQKEGIAFLGAIPIDPVMVVAADRGIPAVDLPGASPAKNAFITLAETVQTRCRLASFA